MADLKIDPEFQKLIPPLSLEELHTLEENLVAHGCRDALVTWNGTLIDGHNRYAICRQYGLKFSTVEMEFGDRDDVLIWIVRNQLGRRNLTDFSRVELAMKLEPILAKKAKENSLDNLSQYRGGLLTTSEKTSEIRDVLEKDPENDTPKTRDVLAKSAGVSPSTIQRSKTIIAKADEQTKENLRAGKTTIGKAYKEIKEKDAKPEPEDDGDQEQEELTPLSIAVKGLNELAEAVRQARTIARKVFAFDENKQASAPYLNRASWVTAIGMLNEYLRAIDDITPVGGTEKNPKCKLDEQIESKRGKK